MSIPQSRPKDEQAEMTPRQKRIDLLLTKMRSLPFGAERLSVFDEVTALRGEELKELVEVGKSEVQAFANARPGGRQGPVQKVGFKKRF